MGQPHDQTRSEFVRNSGGTCLATTECEPRLPARREHELELRLREAAPAPLGGSERSIDGYAAGRVRYTWPMQTPPPIQACLTALDAILALRDSFPAGRKGDPTVAIGPLRDSLRGHDWPPTLNSIAYGSLSLLDALGRTADSEEARQAVEMARSAMHDLAEWQPDLDLAIGGGDLAADHSWRGIPEALRSAVRHLTGTTLDRTFDLALDLLEAPPPAAPQPKPTLFTPRSQGPTAREASRRTDERGDTFIEMEDETGQIAHADSAVRALVPDDSAPAIIVWTYDYQACLVPNHIVRTHWWDLVSNGYASDALIFPPDAAWLICYFHHDYIDVVERITPWRHRISLP